MSDHTFKITMIVIPVVAVIAVIAIVIVAVSASGHESLADTINRACLGHQGVSRLVDGSDVVICKDGLAASFSY